MGIVNLLGIGRVLGSEVKFRPSRIGSRSDPARARASLGFAASREPFGPTRSQEPQQDVSSH